MSNGVGAGAARGRQAVVAFRAGGAVLAGLLFRSGGLAVHGLARTGGRRIGTPPGPQGWFARRTYAWFVRADRPHAPAATFLLAAGLHTVGALIAARVMAWAPKTAGAPNP